VLELAVFAGLDPATLQLYHVQDEKLLIAGCLKGEQGPHFDWDDTAEKLRKVFTVILYLTDDADSTAFPEFKQDKFAPPEFAEDEITVLNAEELANSVERGCLEKDRYVRWKVRVGDMAIFTQACMHFGTQCTWSILHERQALFSVLTPYEGARQDDFQVRSRKQRMSARTWNVSRRLRAACVSPLHGLSCCRFIGQSRGNVEAKRVATIAMYALLPLSPSLSLAFAQKLVQRGKRRMKSGATAAREEKKAGLDTRVKGRRPRPPSEMGRVMCVWICSGVSAGLCASRVACSICIIL
jgi:hypothetical protein